MLLFYLFRFSRDIYAVKNVFLRFHVGHNKLHHALICEDSKRILIKEKKNKFIRVFRFLAFLCKLADVCAKLRVLRPLWRLFA